jgi:hypothetical protein
MRGMQAISAALIIILFVPHLHAQDLHSGSYKDGQTDRLLWELWYSSLKGKSRAGAKYWADHRSIPKTPSCADADVDGSYAWQGGCNEARRRLTASDQRRKLDPEYRQGWDAPEPSSDHAAIAPAPSSDHAAIVPSPAYAEAPSPQSTQVDQRQDSFQNVSPIAPATPSSEAIPTYISDTVNKIVSNTMVILAVLCFLLYSGYRWYYRVRRYKMIIIHIEKETSKHAKILALRRHALISDGTLRSHEWDKEKILFTRARILPILQTTNLTKFHDKLSCDIDGIIERAARDAKCERSLTIQPRVRELFKKHTKKNIIRKRI